MRRHLGARPVAPKGRNGKTETFLLWRNSLRADGFAGDERRKLSDLKNEDER